MPAGPATEQPVPKQQAPSGGDVSRPDAAPFFLRMSQNDNVGTLYIEGTLTLAEAPQLWRELRHCADPLTEGGSLHFDLSRLDSVDGGCMALLVQLRADLHRRGAASEFRGAQPHVQTLIHLYSGDIAVGPRKQLLPKGTLEEIGDKTSATMTEVQQMLGFLGSVLLSTASVLRRPRSANWRELGSLMERAGADAVPIVVLINFLIGFVMGFQGAVQLKQFGANIFVADLVGLSICRELGPLMTAIILCGRSGASFAAEIGSMKVSEEIDALRTMGFGPLRFLVLPRVLALMLVMPLLTLIGDAMGLIGGLVVGVGSLDLTMTGYLYQTQKALSVWDVFSGVIKSSVFAIVIALIACQQGLAATGGAQGVGRRTTSSVVLILFTLILVDAAFTMVFWALGL